MNIWMIEKKFSETSLPEKEDYYIHLNMKDITDADYVLAERIEIKILGEYHDFYVQGDTDEIRVLKYMGLILLIFFMHQDYHAKQL